MTEDEGKAWISARFGTASLAPLGRFAELVIAEAGHQNLIAASTLDQIWSRHIVDSAQLVPLATSAEDGLWLDVGSGAGFPGIVTAILSGRDTILVEPRKRRVAFLQSAIAALDIDKRVSVVASKVEAVASPAAIISARAVSQIDSLFDAASKSATKRTLWVLPKGRSAQEEVERAKQSWHGVFHVEHSVTDPDSLIVVASKVSHR